jgi:phosphopantothenoylcysteine decarboxylase/phosphopantothenate--cysteine ligase
MNHTADNKNRPCECLVLVVTSSAGAWHIPDRLRYLEETFARTIHVIMSRSATHFVSANALRLLSGNPVLIDQFAEDSPFAVPHIQLSERAQQRTCGPDIPVRPTQRAGRPDRNVRPTSP